MNPETLEGFVDADEAARFLSLTRRRVLDLARSGRLPGHPISDGARRVWRFRLSELAAAFGDRSKLSQVMNRTRRLSLSMIRNLGRLGLPAELLLQDTRRDGKKRLPSRKSQPISGADVIGERRVAYRKRRAGTVFSH